MRVAAIKSVVETSARRGERQQRGVRRWFSGAGRIAAKNGGKIMVDPEIAQDFFAQILRLVGANREPAARSADGVETFGNPRKRKIARNFDVAISGSKLLEIGGGMACMDAHDGCDHRLAADRIHRPDDLAVSQIGNTAICEHLIDDKTCKARTVDKRAVKIENDVFERHLVHIRFLNGSMGPALV